jgi:tryptophanyl-tRNA synthetase
MTLKLCAVAPAKLHYLNKQEKEFLEDRFLNTTVAQPKRVLSGMRASGMLHLGHLHGVINNWVKLQHEHECFFMVADWHGLTTHYENPHVIKESTDEMILEWLASGVNPSSARIFIQSKVPEIAELFLLLGMFTPLGWLERVPTYKDQQEKLKEHDLSTYGFLGYPLLQSADVLAFKGDYVPVGEDQVPHIEMIREIARRFNHLYGQEPDFENLAEAAVIKMGKKNAKLYRNLRKAYQEQGDAESLETAKALLESQQNITLGDKERLFGYLEGINRMILPEPDVLLTPFAKMPGLDGRKMSKSYGNTIMLRDEAQVVETKIKKMPTDPARVKRTDPGEPDKCPVWQLHEVYSEDDTKEWIQQGCRTAGIGCLDCKKPLIDSVNKELDPIRVNIKEMSENKQWVESVVTEGCEAAREEARETLIEVREAMGLED